MRNRMSALLVCAVVVMWSNTGIGAAPPVQRSFTTGSFVLELDGLQVGQVSGVEGGLPFGDVVKEVEGEEPFFKKHLGNSAYRDIRLEITSGMDKSLYTWIADAVQGKQEKKDGAILTVDYQGTVRRRLEFTRAQITEVTIPTADGTSKETTRILIGLTPEQTFLNRSPGATSAKASNLKRKIALTSSFSFAVDGLNGMRVSKVEALTVKIPLMRSGGPEECYSCENLPPPASTKIDVSNVIVTLADLGSEPVYDWFDKFVIQGENSDAQEKTGTLIFLTSDMHTPLFTIRFNNLGIFDLMPVPGETGSVAQHMAAMYCESIQFTGQ